MTIEQQVCSRELSERLEKLGVKQESLFYWKHIGEHQVIISQQPSLIKGKILASAFTVAELGVLLREAYEQLQGKIVHSSSARIQHLIRRINNFEDEANSRGKMLAYLIENKLIPS